MGKREKRRKKSSVAVVKDAVPVGTGDIGAQELSATVREDPAEAAQKGDRLRFSTRLLNYFDLPQPGPLSDISVFDGAILALVFGTKSASQIHGSAFLVAPGIAICATHVLHEHIPNLMASQSQLMAVGFGIFGLQLWQVREVTALNNSDLTILGLEYASDIPPSRNFNQLVMTTRVPPIGEKVTIVGVVPGSKEATAHDGGDIELGVQVMLSQGPVTQHYLAGRDRTLMPGSCIEAGCHTWGSMSGGPVFDQSGRLVGLLSSSLESEALDGPSWISLLWPALGTAFKGGWPQGVRGGATTLLDFDPRVCAIEGRDDVIQFKDDTGPRIRLRVPISIPG